MEIRDQAVDMFEAMSWKDGQIGFGLDGGTCLEGADTFEYSQAGCPDCDDLASLIPGSGERTPGFSGDREPLRVDAVILDHLGLDRPKGARSDMQSHWQDLNSFRLQFFDQAFVEMESCGRSRHCASMVGEDGLIAFAVETILAKFLL